MTFPSLTSLEIKGAAVLLLTVVLIGGYAWVIHDAEQRGAALSQAAATAAALRATEAARAEDQRRVAAQKEIDNETQRMAARARADAHTVAAALPGVRAAFVAACVSPAASHPATIAGVASAASEPDLRPDVFGEVGDRLGALAAEADLRGRTGTSCERKYDALTPPTDSPPEP